MNEVTKLKKKSKFLVKKLRIVNAIESGKAYPGDDNTWYLDMYHRLMTTMEKC